MRNIIHDFVIFVGGNRASKMNITEEHAYSKRQAIQRARELSMLYPTSEILVEHWLFVKSHNFIKSGFYKGKVFHVAQVKAA